jgi:hypothetical protein|tara:strand:+ start:1008 stop:1685 length:678 start_codon:yes stop_codon:yes gene_type:complete
MDAIQWRLSRTFNQQILGAHLSPARNFCKEIDYDHTSTPTIDVYNDALALLDEQKATSVFFGDTGQDRWDSVSRTIRALQVLEARGYNTEQGAGTLEEALVWRRQATEMSPSELRAEELEAVAEASDIPVEVLEAQQRRKAERYAADWVRYGEVALDFANRSIQKGVSDNLELPEDMNDVLLRACANTLMSEAAKTGKYLDIGLIHELKPYKNTAMSLKIWAPFK